MEKQVVIGTIIAPHGVRGDIRILPQTDHPEQFLELSSLLLEDGRSLQITSARFHKRMVLMKCRGVETMNDAELLLGLPVFDTAGTQLGTLKDVLSTGSNDVYVIAVPEGKDILVPALKKHVKEINITDRKIVVELPEWTDAP